MAVAPKGTVSSDAARSETLEELFLALESPLLSYALRMAGEAALAEDLVQEAFMKLQQHFHEVREPRPWLYRTVHNLALNHHRSAARLTPLPDPGEGERAIQEPADPEPLPDEVIARWEGIGQVRLSLVNLDPRSRELIRLKFQEELSYKQISERTGLTVGHVGYLLHHALKSLAAELAKSGYLP